MPSALLEAPVSLTFDAVPRKRWSRGEIDELISKGFLDGQDYELIDGELINKMGKMPPHVMGVLRIQEWLIGVFGFWRVRKQDPVNVAAEDNNLNQPEPDLVVLRESGERYGTRHPGPSEIVLAIEVSDTTLGLDRSKKAELYARAGIPDYWILDIKNRRISFTGTRWTAPIPRWLFTARMRIWPVSGSAIRVSRGRSFRRLGVGACLRLAQVHQFRQPRPVRAFAERLR